jgi:PKD repeat protein
VGSYDASLTVTDEDGASDSVSFTIEVTVVQDGNLEIIID